MKALIILISEIPNQMRPEYYEGMSLDVSKISSSEPILKTGKMSITSVLDKR